MLVMSEPIEKLADGPVDGAEPRRNRGWFRPGDGRINREGRPRGSKAAAPAHSPPTDRAERADRLMRLFVGQRELACCLSRPRAPWVSNLPADFRVVACRVDESRGGVVFVVRSDSFRRVARGAPIPEFEPEFNGMMFCR
jgi:hypothetical protein